MQLYAVICRHKEGAKRWNRTNIDQWFFCGKHLTNNKLDVFSVWHKMTFLGSFSHMVLC